MKRIIILFCSLNLILLSGSCSPSIPPNSSLSMQYFSITSPNEDGWTLLQESEPRTAESIWLQRGHGARDLSSADYPIKTMMILRKTITDTILDEKMLRIRLNKITMDEVKKIIDNLSNRFSIENFYFHSFSFNDNYKYYYPFYYMVYFRSDHPLGQYETYANVYLGDGFGHYYIYLPKFYNEYKS
jgi:hypothetical protein